MGKKKGKKKVKKSCCGKYIKKGKHSSKCPVLVKKACKLKTARRLQKRKLRKRTRKRRNPDSVKRIIYV